MDKIEVRIRIHIAIPKNTPNTYNLSYFNQIILYGYSCFWQLEHNDKIAKNLTRSGKSYYFAHGNLNYVSHRQRDGTNDM
jgi:hypothetical protein